MALNRELLTVGGFVLIYLAVQRWVLPKLGIAT